MKITIHLGIHKTGTTLIQNWILKSKADWISQGIDPVIRDKHPILKNSLRLLVKEKLSPADFKDKWETYLDKIQSRNVNHILISDENLLGDPVSIHYKRNDTDLFYPNANQRLKLLASLIEGHEVECILYTRKQESLIRSLYMDGLKYMRYDVGLNEFTSRCLESNISFSNLISTFPSLFSENLRLEQFETIKKGSTVFLETFAKPLGITINYENPGVVNKSINAFQADLLRQGVRLELSKEAQIAYRQKVIKMDEKPSNLDIYKLTPSVVDQIRQRFKDDFSYK